jgi:IS605 OrfB family transposase
MQLVARHVIKRADPRFVAIVAIDAANCIVRQSFIAEGVYLNYPEMDRRMQGHEAYQALPAKVAQWVLRFLDQTWQSFFAALTAWQKDPTTFVGKPKLPGYKDKQKGRNLLVDTIQALSIPALRQGLIAPSRLGVTVRTKRQSVQQVRIIPRTGFSVVEVIHEREPVQAAVDPMLRAGCDIGLNNLATLTSDKPGFVPRSVNGRPVKSINQFYNKRARRIDQYLHTVSKRIIDLLVAEGVGTLCSSQNPLWKHAVRLGKRNNQTFVSVLHARFIELLTYKADLVGIQVQITEESYASQASFLDSDPLPVYGSGRVPFFSGRRVKRGLYRAADGTPINADVNGAYNVMRKVAPEAFARGRRGGVVHPMRPAA